MRGQSHVLPSHFAIDVDECPECKGKHRRIGLKPLQTPNSEDGLTYTHSYACPQTGGTVKLAMLSDGVVN